MVRVANLPLHYGNCPKWLFNKMKLLSSSVSNVIISEYGIHEYMNRISDPFWFQAFGNVLGFDWHSSGLTTTVCGALKESLNKENLGVVFCGGKGKVSLKTEEEIENFGEKFSLSDNKIKKLKYSSRIIRKIDNNLIQDNYQLYHHVFVLSESGDYGVIQQGMNNKNNYARRYHWNSQDVVKFINPNSAVCCDKKEKEVLDLTSNKSEETRKVSLDLSKENPVHFKKYVNGNKKLTDFFSEDVLNMPKRHYILKEDFNFSGLKRIYEYQPKNYEELVGIPGVGLKTIRALSLISNLVYGSEISWRDPVKYSFAHGGKDGYPYKVNKKRMQKSIQILNDAIKEAKLGNKDKLMALRRLKRFSE